MPETASDPIDRLIDGVARRALDRLLHPPGADDPVVRFASPTELAAEFDATAGLVVGPGAPIGTEVLLEAVDQIIGRSVATSHPRFLNQNFAGADPVAVVGDWLGAALNTTAATFEAAPVFTLMENALLDRLAELAGYPAAAGPSATPPGLFCPGGSTATLYALQLARHRAQPDLVTAGAGGRRWAVFVSGAAHYSAKKSAALLGLGTDAVVEVATDDDGAMVPDELEGALAAASLEGRQPLAVIGTAGTTVTAAFDDLGALATICERHDLWFHVDGCYGGSSLFSPTQAHRMRGVERSDSFVWNLHKMLGITQQCTALLVRDPSLLAPCFAIGADYLFQPDKQFAEHDAGDRTFQCARRVDSLKLWLTWKARGEAAFATRIDHAVAMAAHARAIIAADDSFAALVTGSFTNVVFVWVPPELRPLRVRAGRLEGPSGEPLDEDTRRGLHEVAPRIKARMQAEGTALVGYQPVQAMNAFRLLFMNPAVEPADVEAVLALIAKYGTEAW